MSAKKKYLGLCLRVFLGRYLVICPKQITRYFPKAYILNHTPRYLLKADMYGFWQRKRYGPLSSSAPSRYLGRQHNANIRVSAQRYKPSNCPSRCWGVFTKHVFGYLPNADTCPNHNLQLSASSRYLDICFVHMPAYMRLASIKVSALSR